MKADKTKVRKLFHKNLFFDDKFARLGLVSIGLGRVSIVTFIIGVVLSYRAGGEGSYKIGSLALTSLILSAFGIYAGFKGFKEEDKIYLPCKIGIIMCGSMVTFMLAIFAIGI